MRRERLRDTYTAEELAQVYATPHQHFGQPDHRIRVALTIQLGRALGRLNTVADLSCGDGAILGGLDARTRMWGDIAPGWDVTGPIEQTIEDLDDVDLFVCAETIEHVRDVQLLLSEVRRVLKPGGTLALTTPASPPLMRPPEPLSPHLRFLTRGSLRKLLGEMGFQVHSLDRRAGTLFARASR